ncbi:peptide deformylase [Desulfitobacterium hafniense DCB-2]|uniref:Peptide deformylase n=5 Tax=root TaxID=1 RepID=DEF_DESHD|nr:MULTISPECIES: peptide deformylase [Desulfitobacterium]B8FS81.1 RecName: Full=Peptide deformylase; Short=PDF; AltName: Full=Polypeptide deformylase [Desulfitobacterium hafniense DCB-2]ACL21869.1 peptide deformylase [Desulfitobacterium hafniense DCB-2]EHL07033.1 peptide deformylase [Desulfitobacterium hafniense DP7]MEA5022494.1 peptide deformylase [Desulfitobacterium hafniense]CDX02795.1 Peptide deformylase [Desulfitobacterium hafniense]SHN72814.1 peptide deformylase [Desulfitobacterium chlo
MAIYQIVEIGSEVLREKAVPVKEITPNIAKLLDNMLDTLYDANGVGLAAPQVGVSKRVVVIDVGEGPLELINPVIIAKEGEDLDDEGCLSIPGITGQVARAAKVKVEALNRQGELQVIEGEGLLSRCLQHEIDHLEGILFVDKAKKTSRR